MEENIIPRSVAYEIYSINPTCKHTHTYINATSQ